MKRLYNKALSVFVAFMLIITSICSYTNVKVFAATQSGTQAQAVNIHNPQPVITSGGLKLEKYVTPVDGEDRTFDISLKVTGNARKSSTDVVLVLDHSLSMRDTWHTLAAEAKSLVQNLMSKDNIRLSVISFDGVIPNQWNTVGATGDIQRDTQVVTNHFNDNKNQVLSAIDRIIDPISGKMPAGSGYTDTEAAFKRVQSELATSTRERPDSDRYVVFFTDGLPTLGLHPAKNGVNPMQVDQYDANGFRASAIRAYNDIKDQAHFITIGYTGNLNNQVFNGPTEKSIAEQFTKTIQNSGIYNPQRASDLQAVFTKIGDSIHAIHKIARETKIKDIVTDKFDIEPGTATVTDLSTNTVRTDIKPTVGNDNSLVWSVGDLNDTGVLIKFRVHTKNQYDSGNNIDTNVNAEIQDTDLVDNQTKTGTFPKPNVDLLPTKATITIKKVVDSIQSLSAPSNDEFPINIMSRDKKQNYSFNLKNGETKTFEVYLKDINTTQRQSGVNYVDANHFDVSEIVPMNYTLQSIDHKQFILDKNHKDITILVTNKYVNDKYFTDKFGKQNSLQMAK